MKTPEVLLHTDAPEMALEIVARHHPDLSPTLCTTFADLAPQIDESRPEVVYTLNFARGRFPREALVGADSVRWISNSGSGVNHLTPWDPARQTVTNSAGVAADAMSQYAIGTMLHYALDIPGLQADQRDRMWRSRRIAPLFGKTLVIVGLGKTGCATARLAEAMGMTVLGVRARPRETPHVAEVFATEDLLIPLARADYILVCLPLLPGTRGMFDSNAFSAVKPGAIFVDVSRGGIVRSDALIDALDAGRIAGAALDV
ncbi:MAG: NAD(P)-dependent oxidoreductase, partial [Pseudomonadota bacterium]